MLIGNSIPKLVFVRCAIFGLRLVAPASLIYCASSIAFRRPVIARSPWLIALTTWCSAESLFFLLAYLPIKWQLQNPSPPPPPRGKTERHALISKCFEDMPNPDLYISKWFLNADIEDIKRENVRNFFAWSLLDAQYQDLDSADEAELDGYIDRLEERLGWEFKPGWGKARSLRLAFDKVPIQHRPLIWYAIVSAVECSTVFRLYCNGFQFHRVSFADSLKSFPCRPHSLLTRHRSPSAKLSYWYRQHTSRRRSPVLFIHGIGIGMYANVDLLLYINSMKDDADDGELGIIAIEVMPISSRICPTALSAGETRDEIKKILDAYGWDNFVLIGHSYGSAIAATILRDPTFPTTSIRMAILLDPISFMLHLPDVAYNFTRRRPSSASEWMLYYFTCTDPLISHTIARRFQWKDLNLFKDEIPPSIPLTVTLSGKDIIVPAREVWQYLTGVRIEDQVETLDEDAIWKSRDGKLTVFWFGKFNHADIFDSKGVQRGIASVIRHQGIEENGSVNPVESENLTSMVDLERTQRLPRYRI